jgi:hypothetical protein
MRRGVKSLNPSGKNAHAEARRRREKQRIPRLRFGLVWEAVGFV